jgi:hypothetical protein
VDQAPGRGPTPGSGGIKSARSGTLTCSGTPLWVVSHDYETALCECLQYGRPDGSPG